MLARLKERMPGVPTIQSRIEDLRLRRRFHLVIAPSSILNTDARLKRAAAHLAVDGRLLFELANPRWLKEIQQDPAAYTDGARVRVLEMTIETARLEIDYPLLGGAVYTQLADLNLVWPEQVEGWLESAGLRLERLSGSGADLEDSPTFYVSARARLLRPSASA
jgi:hypothetical protein